MRDVHSWPRYFCRLYWSGGGKALAFGCMSLPEICAANRQCRDAGLRWRLV